MSKTVASQGKKGPGFGSANLLEAVIFQCGAHMFTPCLSGFPPGCSSFFFFFFLPQSKDKQVRSTGNSTLPVGVNVFVSLYVRVSSVIDW